MVGEDSQFQRRERGDFLSIIILKMGGSSGGGNLEGRRTGRRGGLDGVKEDPKWRFFNV